MEPIENNLTVLFRAAKEIDHAVDDASDELATIRDCVIGILDSKPSEISARVVEIVEMVEGVTERLGSLSAPKKV